MSGSLASTAYDYAATVVYNSYVRFAVVASTSLAVLLSGLLYFKQSALIYPRDLPEGSRTDVPTPDEFGVADWEHVILVTPDKEVLKCFLLKAAGNQTGLTTIFFHGNAGNIGHRIPIAKVFSDELGSNVLMVSYRGYGFSSGRPSEKGLLIDAQTALDWVLKNPDLRDDSIIVYGQSLGGALGIQLVAKNQEKVAGLILENTFRSMRTLIPCAFPPAKYLARFCHQIWPSEATIPSITNVPILFLSGLKDELVPPSHMKALHDCARTRKYWQTFPEGRHNDTVTEAGYFEAILEFFNTLNKKAS